MRHLLVVLLIILSAASVNASDGDLYKNPTARFEVTKPNEWHFLTADENHENLSRVQLEDDEFHALMIKYSAVPMVAMTKHLEPFDDLNPSFKVNIKPLGQLKGMSVIEIMELFPPQLEGAFKDFELIIPPSEVEVSGMKSGYIRINYTLESTEGQTYPTTSELWIIPRGDYYFMIGAGTRQDGKTGTRSEIQSIMNTVKIWQ